MSTPKEILLALKEDTLKRFKNYKTVSSCKPLKESTKKLEGVVRASLHEATSHLVYSFNKRNELIATWQEGTHSKIVNVSDILAIAPLDNNLRPDFEHLTLHLKKNSAGDLLLDESGTVIYDQTLLKLYSNYVKKVGGFKATQTIAALGCAKNIALNIYTQQYYSLINNFLREAGKITDDALWNKEDSQVLTGITLQIRIKDILYAIVVGSHALNQLPLASLASSQLAFREEYVKNPRKAAFFQKRLTLFKQAATDPTQPALLHEPAFLSTSDFDKSSTFVNQNKQKSNVYTLYLRGLTSKSISAVSKYSKEAEILHPPGTKFKCLAHTQQKMALGRGNSYFFVMMEHAAPDSDEDDYTFVSTKDCPVVNDSEGERVITTTAEDYVYLSIKKDEVIDNYQSTAKYTM